jgi:hypothetical protein
MRGPHDQAIEKPAMSEGRKNIVVGLIMLAGMPAPR